MSNNKGKDYKQRKLKEMFAHITSVQLELSNMCNLAIFHKNCYSHLCEKNKSKVVLSSKAVKGVINLLADLNWDGMDKEIKFHEYNEPLIDPRFFKFLEYAKLRLPYTNILLWTNGYYLTNTILRELIEAGVNKIRITAYTEDEENRFNSLIQDIQRSLVNGEIRSFNMLPIFIRVDRRVRLDDRLSISQKQETNLSQYQPCHSLKCLSIRANGKITLCCMDAAGEVSFGNINSGIEEALINGYPLRKRIYDELKQGLRSIDLCRKCDFVRPDSNTVSDKWGTFKIWDKTENKVYANCAFKNTYTGKHEVS